MSRTLWESYYNAFIREETNAMGNVSNLCQGAQRPKSHFVVCYFYRAPRR